MLKARHRRLSTYLYLQDLLQGAAVLEVMGAPGAGDAEALSKAGARTAEVRESLDGVAEAAFDVVIALDAQPATLQALVAQAGRALKPAGTLVVGGPNGDRPGADGGFSFYDLSDACQARFEEVKMLGQAPFFAASLVEYGVPEPEPVLDGRLVEKGEKVERYLAVAGPKKGRTRGYGVVQLPFGELESAPATVAPAPAAVPAVAAPDARVAELEAECNKLREKEKDARAEAWKALKARSEAEAAAAEVREDTVRKLKDARKLASVELMRAMEEATKKNVSLKEELVRTERERKEFKAEVARLVAELEAIKAPIEVARAKEEGDAAVLAVRAQAERSVHDEEAARAAADEAARAAEEKLEALRGRVQALERELGEAQRLAEAERERAARMSEGVPSGDERARLEVDAKRHAEENVRVREQLAGRERELASLVGELESARARSGELELELQRREGAVERAAAAAGHERARAERLVADERHAMAERNEARARTAEAEARAAQLGTELEQLHGRLSAETERAHKAENEVLAKKERVKQLKRELEESERRLAERVGHLDVVRERLGAVEDALRGEEQRMAGLEEALRRAAMSSAPPTPPPTE
jgi:hypothetical protein